MERHRFEALPRTLAGVLSRRAALRRLGGGSLAAATGLAAGGGLARAAAQEAAPHPALVGTWKSLVTTAEGRAIATLITFISDGTLIQTNSDHPTRSPAHGVWEQTGDGEYAWAWERLVFDEAGALIETMKSRARITVDEDGDTIRWETQAEFLDLAGTRVRGPIAATAEGTRLKLEPLPAEAGTPVA